MVNNSFDVDLYFLQYNLVHSSVVRRLEVFLCVLNSILVVPGIVENLILVLAIWRTSSLHSPSNVILCSLAISDFLNCLILQPALVVHMAAEIHLNLSLHIITGILWETAAAITASVSAICVMLLSFDRYLALRLHLSYIEVFTHKRAIIVVVTVWISQCFLSGFRFIDNADQTVMIITLFMVESTFICVFLTNFKVFQTVRKHQNTINIQVHAVSQEESRPIVNINTFKKTAITMSYIVGTFCLFYLPFNGALIGYIASGHRTTAVRMSFYTCVTIGIVSSFINPLICYYRIRNVRRAILRLIPMITGNVLDASTGTGVKGS